MDEDEGVGSLVLIHVGDKLPEEPGDEEHKADPKDNQADGQGNDPGHGTDGG